MTRRFRTTPAVPDHVVTELVRLAQRAPSAGLTQGDVVAPLTDAADRDLYWSVTTDPDAPGCLATRSGRRPGPVAHAGRPAAYLDRYVEPDMVDGPVTRSVANSLLGHRHRDGCHASSHWGRRTVAFGSLFFRGPGGATMPCAPLSTSPTTDVVGVITHPATRDRSSRSLARQGSAPGPRRAPPGSLRGRLARRSEGPSPPLPFVKMQGSYAVRPPSELTEPHGSAAPTPDAREARRGADRRHRRVRGNGTPSSSTPSASSPLLLTRA